MVIHQGFTLEIGKYSEISLCHIRGHFMENPCGLQAPVLCGPHQEEGGIGVSLHCSGVFFPFPETTTCMHVISVYFYLAKWNFAVDIPERPISLIQNQPVVHCSAFCGSAVAGAAAEHWE